MRLEDEIKASKFRDEVHKAQLNILFSAAWLRARISATLKPHGVTMEQFNVLRIIRGQRNKTVLIKDISSRMLERNSNITRIIGRLEAKGFVERRLSARDRRERPVALTPAGLAVLENIDRSWQKNNPHSAPWTAEEAETVNRLLDKMRGNPQHALMVPAGFNPPNFRKHLLLPHIAAAQQHRNSKRNTSHARYRT